MPKNKQKKRFYLTKDGFVERLLTPIINVKC